MLPPRLVSFNVVRVSVRRIVAGTTASAVFFFVLFNVQSNELWPVSNDLATDVRPNWEPNISVPVVAEGTKDRLWWPINSWVKTVLRSGRLWFLRDGTTFEGDNVTLVTDAELFPNGTAHDRIIEQLMFRPPRNKSPHPKKILLFNGIGSWPGVKTGMHQFMKCPVKSCALTTTRGEVRRADAILFKDHVFKLTHRRDPAQIWILYMLECPHHTQTFRYNDLINWTATYRHDSEIVTPYEKWVYYDASVRGRPQMNYARNKTKKVAWFVSNCQARNNRLHYAYELAKYIEVDIYGTCGNKVCPRSAARTCFDMLKSDYKFYLAFENSNCRDYITEKFFVNGLANDVLPIVMGAHPDDYRRSAPYRSYIHVDDYESPKDLAEYLHKLDRDDHLYNQYFQWKGTGEFINTYFFCRLCSMLHSVPPNRRYSDINDWWRGSTVCISGSWNKLR